MEDLEEKQLQERISVLENENSNIKEQVWKLEHGRNWYVVNRLPFLIINLHNKDSEYCMMIFFFRVENRLSALEADIQTLKEGMKNGS